MGLKLQIGPVINRGKHRVSVGIRAGWSRARAGIRRLLCSSGASLEEHRAREGGEGATAGNKITVGGRRARVEVPRDPGRPHAAAAHRRAGWRAVCSVRNDGRPTRGSEILPAVWLLPRQQSIKQSGPDLESE